MQYAGELFSFNGVPQKWYAVHPAGGDSPRDRILYSLIGVWEGRPDTENLLTRLIVEFPGGLAGLALLCLRAVLGSAVCLEGVSYVDAPNATAEPWLIGIAALFLGAFLVIGYLTPISCGLILAGAIGVSASLLPASTPNLIDSIPARVFALTILIAVFGLGPGAFSLDARLFGRREIIIPPAAKRSESID